MPWPYVGTQQGDELAPGGIRRVVVRSPNWVGDAIHSLPALDAIRCHFATAEIAVLARGEVATLLADYPAVDRVISYRRGPGAFVRPFRVAAQLRAQVFDLGILMTNALEGAWLFFLAGIPRRCGYATDGRRWLLTDPVPCPPRTKNLHQADYYLALLSSMGIKLGPSRLHLQPTAAERHAAEQRLLAAGWCSERRLVALCPGASYGSAKRWPVERFAALAKQLITHQAATVVLLGGPTERGMGREIAGSGAEHLLNLIGQTTLREAMALLDACNLVVSNDSGLLHLAVEAGTPAVALFGPTDPNRTGPRGANVATLRKPVVCSPCEMRECPIGHHCMDWISVDEVYDAVVSELKVESGKVTQGLVRNGNRLGSSE